MAKAAATTSTSSRTRSAVKIWWCRLNIWRSGSTGKGPRAQADAHSTRTVGNVDFEALSLALDDDGAGRPEDVLTLVGNEIEVEKHPVSQRLCRQAAPDR